MRMTAALTLCCLLAACADGGSASDRARNGHDLGAFGNAGLALQSEVRTDARNVDDIARRAGAAVP
ncbi:hypothetical protein D3273_20100 [Lichenibacterium minor]|uniref:Uncharacterized protein n=1 Tax=Lichenibacterium minor TaxID=2316528 RepID=A0A4Q2U234_9HYPH|nr:hypothetical protein [Lichenibacterium minor]RYC30180.1 hypothetical protein D3273_20100 [Lichenibacterium minor]